MTDQAIKNQYRVDLEFTPNPNTLKYVTDVAFLLAGAHSFKSAEEAQGKSELASELFKLNDIAAIMVGKNFITVTLSNQDALTELNDQIINTMKSFLASGKPAVNIAAVTEQQATQKTASNDAEARIMEILDQEIRPQVAMDGGDITFEKFEDGIVFLHMKGSCAGCPSSTATLKMGIENRLRDAIPEVKEVVAI